MVTTVVDNDALTSGQIYTWFTLGLCDNDQTKFYLDNQYYLDNAKLYFLIHIISVNDQ